MRNLILCYDIYKSLRTNIICVTGCGPNLSKDHVPANSFIIGVNRSFEKIIPNIICTADERAKIYIEEAGRKEKILFSIDMNLTVDDRQLYARKSGTFAILIASIFHPKEIHITGFGGKGHFHSEVPFVLLQEEEIVRKRHQKVIDSAFAGLDVAEADKELAYRESIDKVIRKRNNKTQSDAEALEEVLKMITCKVIIH